MNLNKGFWAFVALPILSVFLLGSCSKDSEEVLSPSSPKVSATLEGEGPELELSLEATMGEDMRMLSFDQVDARTPEVVGDSIEVLCIVRSTSATDEPVYRKIWWKKDAAQGNKIRLHKHKFKFPAGYELAQGKEWYIMGVIGGEWNEATKRLNVVPDIPSSPDLVTNNNKTLRKEMRVPAVSKWVRIPTNAQGEFVFQDGSEVVTYTSMPFQAQGALIQHRIDRNTSKSRMRLWGFKMVSTAFSFEGYFDLSPANLAPLNNSTAGHKNSGMLQWVATGENTDKEYPVTNADVTEYVKDFRMAAGVDIAPESQVDQNLVATIWVMPTGVDLEKARTNVFLDVVPSGRGWNPESTSRLPSYGANHTKLLKTGDFAKITSVIHRPKLAIEYMAEYNVRRNDQTRQWETVGDQRVEGSSRIFATGHGPEADSELRWLEAKNHGIMGYHLPTRPEWEGVIPMASTDADGRLNFKQDGDKYEVTKNVQVGLGATPAPVGLHIKNDGANKTVYAIHFIDDATGNKMRVAYRYRLLPNPEMAQFAGQVAPRVQMRLNGMLEAPRAGYDYDPLKNVPPSADLIRSTDYLSVEMMYLGAYFLGTIDDIAQESWWSAQRTEDVVTRFFSGHGNRNFEYQYITKEEYPKAVPSGQESRSLGIRPWVLTYWLDDPATYNPASIERAYSGISREHNVNNVFYFSPYAASATAAGGLVSQPNAGSGFAGMNVRLFSDK